MSNENTVIISGRNILRQYSEYKALGYRTLWTGNGQICMQAPKPGDTAPEPVMVITEVTNT